MRPELFAPLLVPFLAVVFVAIARWLSLKLRPHLPRWLERVLFIKWGK